MHLTINEIRSLADSYVQEKILNDDQLKAKKHMADCKECYQKFCTEYLLIRTFKETGILPENWNDTGVDEEMQKILLQIKKVGIYLKIQSECGWNFFPVPQMAAARGNTSAENKEIYVSDISKYSLIRHEEGKIIIQLDGDVYSVDHLKVRVITDGNVQEYAFIYDEETECYCVTIDEASVNDESVIDIVEV